MWSFKERNNLQIAFWAARCAELSLRGNEMTTLFGADKLAIRKLAESNVNIRSLNFEKFIIGS